MSPEPIASPKPMTQKDAVSDLVEYLELEAERHRRAPEIKAKIDELKAPLKEFDGRMDQIRLDLADYLARGGDPIEANGFYVTLSRPGPGWSISDPDLALRTAKERKDWDLLTFKLDEAKLILHTKATGAFYPGTRLENREPFISIKRRQ